MSSGLRVQRTAVSMAAVEAPQQSASSRGRRSPARVKEVALVASLVVSVTAGGVAIGAYGVSPLLGEQPMETVRRLASVAVARTFEMAGHVAAQPRLLAVIAATLLGVVAVYAGAGLLRRRAARNASRTVQSTAATFTARTPRDVQVLAAAGKAPADIAARTRLPVDAVSMLLNLGQAQQV